MPTLHKNIRPMIKTTIILRVLFGTLLFIAGYGYRLIEEIIEKRQKEDDNKRNTTNRKD